MKLIVAHPVNGTVKAFDNLSDDHIRKSSLFEHRLGQEIDGSSLDRQFAGYRFKLQGGADKDGFPMMQGVMANARVSLLVARGRVGFCRWRGRNGERRRKNVRGCIMGPDIAVLNVVITKEGEKPIEGLTDESKPRRLGPKRASKIRKLFNLAKADDVKKYVVKRKVSAKGGKTRFKSPKVQRLLTPAVRARRLKKVKNTREQLQKAVAARRLFLSSVCAERLKHRQRRHSKHIRKAYAEAKNVATTGATKSNKKK